MIRARLEARLTALEVSRSRRGAGVILDWPIDGATAAKISGMLVERQSRCPGRNLSEEEWLVLHAPKETSI